MTEISLLERGVSVWIATSPMLVINFPCHKFPLLTGELSRMASKKYELATLQENLTTSPPSLFKSSQYSVSSIDSPMYDEHMRKYVKTRKSSVLQALLLSTSYTSRMVKSLHLTMISVSGGSKEIHKPKKAHCCMYTYSNIHILCMLALSSQTCQHLGWIIHAIWLIRKISTTWGMVGLSKGGVLVQMIASLST